MGKRLKSRILEYFTPELLKKLEEVCKSTRTNDNNTKTNIIIQILNDYLGDTYIELGPGTNRLAILIENYVFKIALDKWGIIDNINEFAISEELQPYVVKTYETNKLITVCEYVTVISREEFIEKKYDIQRVLAVLAESYLLGDVGTISKNYLNWGYRDDGELVILDFAYIYRIKGDEILCEHCKDEIIEYDENFDQLLCPRCRRTYSFMDIRRKIPMEYEKQEQNMALQLSHRLTKPVQEIIEVKNDSEPVFEDNKKEDTFMGKKDKFKNRSEESMESYLSAFDLFKKPSETTRNEGVKVFPADNQLKPLSREDCEEHHVELTIDKREVSCGQVVEDQVEIVTDTGGFEEKTYLDVNSCVETNESDSDYEVNCPEDDEEDDNDKEWLTSEAANCIDGEICPEDTIGDTDRIYDTQIGSLQTNETDSESEECIFNVNTCKNCDSYEICANIQTAEDIAKDTNKTLEVQQQPVEKVSTLKVFCAGEDMNSEDVEDLRKEISQMVDEEDEYEKLYDETDKLKMANKGGKNKKWEQ